MREINNRASVTRMIFLISLICLSISGCSQQGVLPTVSTALVSTELPNATISPTLTPTRTLAETLLDLEKYHTLPPSYDYLMAHKDEFVQAPDPITERVAFDKWFSEQLVPIIGPRQDRQVNLLVSALGQSGGMYSAWPHTKTVPEGQLGFFYFNYSNTLYPVLVINVSRFDPANVDHTFCVALLGGSWAPLPYMPDALEMLSKGGGIIQIDIFTSLSAELISGVTLDEVSASFISGSGDAWANYPDNISFGLGQVYVME